MMYQNTQTISSLLPHVFANYAFMNRYSCLKTTTDNLLYFSLKYCIYKHVILAYLFNPSKFSITVYIYKY